MTPLSCLILVLVALLTPALRAERMEPEEEPEEVGLVSIGSGYFPIETGLTQFPIPNATFESEPRSGNGWTLWGWKSASDGAPQGQTYLQSEPGKSQRFAFAELQAESWQTYLISFWLRSESEIRGSYSAETSIRFGAHTPLNLPSTEGSWKRVGFYVRAPLEATKARVLINVPDTTSISIDDFRYREASKAEFSKAYAGWRESYPDRDLSPRPDDGANLALFLRKLQTPSDPERPLLVMGIGSSYTNMLGNGERLVQHIQEHFPEAPPVHYRKHVGSAVEFDYTQGWMQQLVVGEQPDLVILYSGGHADDLDTLLTDFRARSTADLIVASLHLRERDEVISPETIDNEQWDSIREIARKHGVEFVESRREWAAYLQNLGEDIPYLLKDAVHQSDHGALVINESIVRHFTPPEVPAYDPNERERRFAAVGGSSLREGESLTRMGDWNEVDGALVSESEGASLRLRFRGNRVDLVGLRHAAGGSVQVSIDGIPAEDYPAFHTTLIVPGSDNHRPERGMTADRAPHAIRLGSNVVPQDWTLKMTSDQGDYELLGSVTGLDGKGHNGADFTSTSGQIHVPAALWRRRQEKDGSYSNRTGDTFAWSVYRATAETVSFDSKSQEADIFAESLVQNAENVWHTIEVACLGDGPVRVLGFAIFEPPLRLGSEVGPRG